MGLKIISAGPLSTIQDSGRFGYLQYGFPPSGAMDQTAMMMGNILVGNSSKNASIEMTGHGISAVFDNECVIALTGADMNAKINNVPVKGYRTIHIFDGDRLEMSYATKGMRGYLSIFSGIDIPLSLGSMSTTTKLSLGGLNGNKLADGDYLKFKNETIPPDFIKKVIVDHPVPQDSYTLRCILGPQDDYFTKEGIYTFFNSEFTVSEKSDRMGIRLTGEPIESFNGTDIVSDAVATGSIQVSSDGQPIVLMVDRQTAGGYAKIASIITPDLSSLSQARPGTKIRFKKVEFSEAVKLYKEYDNYFSKLERFVVGSGTRFNAKFF